MHWLIWLIGLGLGVGLGFVVFVSYTAVLIVYVDSFLEYVVSYPHTVHYSLLTVCY